MDTGYLDFVFGGPNANAMGIWNLFLLTLARILPIITITPFFGSKSIPNPAKMALALCLATIMLPHLAAHSKVFPIMNWEFAGLFIKEFFVGLVIAYLATVPFWVAQSSGIVIDFMRGASSMIGQDPTMRNQVSSIGILYNQMTIVIFYTIGGASIFLNAVMSSYLILPPDSWIHPIFFAKGFPFWKQIISLAAHIMSMALQLAAPAIVGSLMAEVFLGIANRLAPQVQIAFLGISIRSMLAIGLLCAGWVVVLHQISIETLNWLEVVRKTTYMFRVK